MHRRDFLCLLAATGIAGCSTQVEKPNVLFFAVDDLNDYASVLGGRAGMHTPNAAAEPEHAESIAPTPHPEGFGEF